MSLLNIVEIALINKSFFGTSYFLPGKTDKNFAWCFERLKLDCYLRNIPSFKVFLMDADPAQIRALRQVFPDTVILLCVWHVNEKIYAKLKPLFKAEMENAEGAESMEIAAFLEWKWKLWKADWITVITSRTEAEYKENLAKLKDKHEAVYPQIINYINQNVLTPYEEKLVRY